MTARCSICGINYPANHNRCRRCTGRLDLIQNAGPDRDWLERADHVDPDVDPGDLRVRVNRMERLHDLGFGLEDSYLLSFENDIVARARRLVDQGCPPDTAARILA